MIGSLVRKMIPVATLAAVFVCGAARAASAESFISPFLGYNFGGDAGCPEISNCENKSLNWGVAFGSIGSVFGTEAEISYAPNFFGEIPGTFYAFPDVSAFLGKAAGNTRITTPDELCDWLLDEHNVATVPGTANDRSVLLTATLSLAKGAHAGRVGDGPGQLRQLLVGFPALRDRLSRLVFRRHAGPPRLHDLPPLSSIYD